MAGSITQLRDLRTGRTPWDGRALPALPTQPLRRSLRCDVAVVGAGISGALIAEALSEAGLQVAILDRRGPILGSTPASTAMVLYEPDTPLGTIAGRIGQERATRIWRRGRLAVAALRERAERLGVRAGQARVPTLYLDGNILDGAGLEREAELRRQAGFEVEHLGPAALADRFGIRRRHALVSRANFTCDPRQLTAGFLAAALARGARLYAPVDVSAIEAGANGVTLGTVGGPEVRAGHVVLATGYELAKGVPRQGSSVLSTWAIATRPQPRALWAERAMIWEAGDPYLYVRAGPRGEVICGGEDEAFADAEARDALIAGKAATLSRKLARLLPGIEATPAMAWAGSFGAAPLSLPTIGQVPGMRRVYAAMGYGGNGITFSMIAAQLLRNLITGGHDADADLFGFSAKRD